MPLIKLQLAIPDIPVTNAIYVATDYVESVCEDLLPDPEKPKFKPIPCFAVRVASGQMYFVTEESGNYLLAQMDADEAFVPSSEIPPATLKAKLAQHLQYYFVGGATEDQLEAICNLANGEAQASLVELIKEEIIVIASISDASLPIYYHVTHAPKELRPASFKPSPDLSSVAEDLANNSLEEGSDPITDLSIPY